MNKRSGLHRHYDRLDADERFRLDVLATAREDWQESERLLASCLRSSYVMNDMGFVGRWQGAIDITLRVYIPLGELLAKQDQLHGAGGAGPQELGDHVGRHQRPGEVAGEGEG